MQTASMQEHMTPLVPAMPADLSISKGSERNGSLIEAMGLVANSSMGPRVQISYIFSILFGF